MNLPRGSVQNCLARECQQIAYCPSDKVHPDGTGALKTVAKPSASPETEGHQDSYGCRACSERAITFALSLGQAHDAPKSVDKAASRARLLSEFNLEIGAGLGDMSGKIWRIGLMGYSAKQENVDYCLKALKACLN